jgi:hypothetical protein
MDPPPDIHNFILSLYHIKVGLIFTWLRSEALKVLSDIIWKNVLFHKRLKLLVFVKNFRVTHSNLSPEIRYPEDFRAFPQFPQESIRLVP